MGYLAMSDDALAAISRILIYEVSVGIRFDSLLFKCRHLLTTSFFWKIYWATEAQWLVAHVNDAPLAPIWGNQDTPYHAVDRCGYYASSRHDTRTPYTAGWSCLRAAFTNPRRRTRPWSSCTICCDRYASQMAAEWKPDALLSSI